MTWPDRARLADMSHTTQGLLQRLPSLSLLGSSSTPWTALTVTTGGAGEGGQAQDYLRHGVGAVSLPQGSTRIPLFRGYTDDILDTCPGKPDESDSEKIIDEIIQWSDNL